MWPLLQNAAKLVTGLVVLFEKLRKLYYRQKFGKLHDTLQELEQKQKDGTLSDDDIIANARKLREQKKGLLP